MIDQHTHDLSADELRALLEYLCINRLWVTSSNVQTWRTHSLPAVRRMTGRTQPELYQDGVRRFVVGTDDDGTPRVSRANYAQTALPGTSRPDAPARTTIETDRGPSVRSLLDDDTKP